MDSLSRQKITFFTETKAWLFLLPMAMAVRLIFLSRAGMPLPDEVYYVQAAWDILQGQNPGDFLMPQNRGQPAWPLVIAALRVITPDLLTAARLLSVVAGSLCLCFLYRTATRYTGASAAFAASIFFIFSPWAVAFSLWAMNHAFFNLCWVGLFWATIQALNRQASRWPVFAGVFAWGASMMRAEGFILTSAALGLSSFFLKRYGLQFFKTAFLTLVVLMIPYWLFLRIETGQWQMTWVNGTSALNFVWERKMSTPDHTFVQLYGMRLAAALQAVLKQAGPIFFLFSVGGIFSLWRSKVRHWLGVGGVMAMLPFIFYPCIGTEPRYYQPALLILTGFAGVGFMRLTQIQSTHRRWGICFVMLIALASFAPGLRGLWLARSNDRPELRQAGEWLRKNAGDYQVLFGGDTRVCYYAGHSCGRFVTLQRYKDAFLSATAPALLKEKQVAWVIDDQPLQDRYYTELSDKIKKVYASDFFTQRASFITKDGIVSIYQTVFDSQRSAVSSDLLK